MALSERLTSSFGVEISQKLKTFSEKMAKIGQNRTCLLIVDGNKPPCTKISCGLQKAQNLRYLDNWLSTCEKAGRVSQISGIVHFKNFSSLPEMSGIVRSGIVRLVCICQVPIRISSRQVRERRTLQLASAWIASPYNFLKYHEENQLIKLKNITRN